MVRDVILGSINEIKKILTDMDSEITSLPKELRELSTKQLDKVRSLLNSFGGSVEKFYQDRELSKGMILDLLDKMKNIGLYDSISDDVKEEIAEKIINSSELELLDSNTLRQTIIDSLLTIEDSEKLVLKAYGKESVIKVGSNLIGHKATETAKYDAGLKAFLEMVETPNGREDALAFGEKRVLENISLRNQYLLSYYGV